MLEQNSARNTKMHAKGAMAEMNSHRTQSNSLQTGIPKVFDLIGLLFHILESAKFVLTAIILCMALYGCSAFFSTPAYVATAKLYVSDPDMDIHDLQIASALVMDYREIFKTWEVHEAVRKDLSLPYSNDQMQSMYYDAEKMILHSNPFDDASPGDFPFLILRVLLDQRIQQIFAQAGFRKPALEPAALGNGDRAGLL